MAREVAARIQVENKCYYELMKLLNSPKSATICSDKTIL